MCVTWVGSTMTWVAGGVNLLLWAVLTVSVGCSPNVVHSNAGETVTVHFSWHSWRKVLEEAICWARVASGLQVP